jgi:hypothetical protein
MNFDVVLDSESQNVLEIPFLMISQTVPIGFFLVRYDSLVVRWGPNMVRLVLWYDNSVLLFGPMGSRSGPVVLWDNIAGPCWSSVGPVGRPFLVRHNPSRLPVF